ncbi:hypothetical protein BDW75DRAFT_230912 [Aspergillus navahoensis]
MSMIGLVDTQSLTASVTEYPIENGRTYHKYHEGSYIFPNDEREMDRLDMQHHLCKMLTGGRLFFAPIINPRNIVDIGTGSGIWPIELYHRNRPLTLPANRSPRKRPLHR